MMFQMISSNGGLFSATTLSLSTVSLPPICVREGVPAYESCLFGTNGASEVISTYDTLAEAIAGHSKLARQLGLDHTVK
jgi:hypothetical protein